MRFLSKVIGRCLSIRFVATLSLLACTVWSAPVTGLLDETHAATRAVMAVQSEVTPSLMQEQGILGAAVGLDESGTHTLVAYVDREADSDGLDSK